MILGVSLKKMDSKIKEYLNHNNYFGVLVYGTYIQEITEIYSNTLLIPLSKLYHNDFVNYIKSFGKTFNFKFSIENLEIFNNDYKDNIPVTFILHKINSPESSNKIFEVSNYAEIDKAKLYLAMHSGQSSYDFFKIIRNNQKIFYKTELLQFNELQRIWVSEEEKNEFRLRTENVITNQKFSITLFQDANREYNNIYKIARYFLVLESIVGSQAESRKAIRNFFLINNYSINYNFQNQLGQNIQIDFVELAGIIRAKLFHGVELKYKYFKKVFKTESDYDFFIEDNTYFHKYMRDMCEVALMIKEMISR